VIADFSARIMRGDRIGIIGPNGCGKTTLDQAAGRRARADERRRSAAAPLCCPPTSTSSANSSIPPPVHHGQRDRRQRRQRHHRRTPRHVSGYLRDFLFPPERLQAPVSMLSGGERNRLLLARLFAKPSNLLVMDEPTNDLDARRWICSRMVADYAGTLLLVSHDRAFLDNVVTSTLVFEGAGRVNEYVGGYSDWLRQRDIGDPQLFRASPVRAAAALERLRELTADIEAAYARWHALESR
jgi:ATP-binding cassette subfamily F protein uup